MIDQHLIKQLIDISLKAGSAIMEIYNTEDKGVEVKSDNSPVTLADKRANEIICNGLNAIEPTIPIISEENKVQAYEERKDYTSFWLVDPLDGTKEFINHTGEFTTNIALIENGRPVVGVIHTPVLGDVHWAAKGLGAFTKNGEREIPLSVASFDKTASNVRIAKSRSHPSTETQAYIDGFDTPEMIVLGSSLKFVGVAKGAVDIYPRMVNLYEWDIAAGVAIVEAAGGNVYNYETNQDISFNSQALRAPKFICSGKILEV